MNVQTPRVPQPSAAMAAKAGKERKQLFMLAGLALVFVVVLVIQFGGGNGVGESTPDDEPALAAAPVPVSQVELPGGVVKAVKGQTPAVLGASGDSANEIKRNALDTIWTADSVAQEKVDEEAPELPPPSINLTGTFTSATNPRAMIDGSLRALGDDVQGWTLVAIGSREVTLRAPNKRVVTVAMPKIPGVR